MDHDWWLRVEMPSPDPHPLHAVTGPLSDWVFDITRELLFSFSVVIMSFFFSERIIILCDVVMFSD